jgi:hopanoid-associated phosphorylase
MLVVTGMRREAECLPGDGVEILCSGADVGLLRAALGERAAKPYAAVVSFGLAGGLDPRLAPGDLIVASAVVSDGAAAETHRSLQRLLLDGLARAGVSARDGAVAGADAPVMSPCEKARLHHLTGAVIVDMESHLALDFAQKRGLPFAVLRAVCDPSERALPPLAAKAVKPDGGVDLALILRELAKNPAQLGGLIAAGRDSGRAFATLGRCGGLLGPLLRLVFAELG